MAFLQLADYLELIDQVALDQITDADNTRISRMELEAISEMKSYLSQRYDVDSAFADLLPFNLASIYRVGNRVKWSADVFSPDSTWVTSAVSGAFNSGELITANNGATGKLIGLITSNRFTAISGDWSTVASITGDVSTETANVTSIALYTIGEFVAGSDGNIYQSLTNNLLDPLFNPSGWGTALAVNNTLYYNVYPNPLYIGTRVYNPGDRVVFLGNVYEATRIMLPGIQPINKDGVTVNTYWKLIGAAGTTTNILPTNTSYWIQGDNRDQLLMQHCIDICLYHLHARINPRNIPELRIDRYRESKNWLEAVAAGKVNCNIPQRYEFADIPGVSISSGNTEFLRSQKSYC